MLSFRQFLEESSIVHGYNSDGPFDAIKNPSTATVAREHKKSAYKTLRYLKYKKDVYVTDANKALHGHIADAINKRKEWDDHTEHNNGMKTGFIKSQHVHEIAAHPMGLNGWINQRHRAAKKTGSWGGGAYISDYDD